MNIRKIISMAIRMLSTFIFISFGGLVRMIFFKWIYLFNRNLREESRNQRNWKSLELLTIDYEIKLDLKDLLGIYLPFRRIFTFELLKIFLQVYRSWKNFTINRLKLFDSLSSVWFSLFFFFSFFSSFSLSLYFGLSIFTTENSNLNWWIVWTFLDDDVCCTGNRRRVYNKVSN